MKKKLVLFGLLVCTMAEAKWIPLEGDGESRTYYDDQSIRRVGDLVKVYILKDIKIPKIGLSHKSTKILYQIDCKADTVKPLAMSVYSDNMGVGNVIQTFNDLGPGAIPIHPRSIGSLLSDIVCQTAKKSGN